jgi:hypothetical protein
MQLPKPPFYGNTSDDTHCLQAVLRMALGLFLPGRDFTWQELDNLSGKRPGKWTWPQHALLAIREMGLSVREIAAFNYLEFAQHGMDYLREHYGARAAEEQDRNCDLPYEIATAVKYAESGIPQCRAPTFDDIERFLSDGQLVVCWVNHKKLEGRRGGVIDHVVLVYGLDVSRVTLHDPGLPPRQAITVDRGRFWRAWASEGEKTTGMFGIGNQRVG